MDAAHVRELASELETTLKLLAQLITELESRREGWMRSGVVRELVHRLAAQPNLAELPAVLLRAHAEITEVLGGLRLTREEIEAHALERIRDTQDRLTDVTSTTESATLELLNGLDRSLELIDHLEAQADGRTPAEGFRFLRRQVSELYTHLQFQDITAQQLQGVTHSLLELETRVAAVAALFDRALGQAPATERQPPAADPSTAHLAFNPDATMKRSRQDQAMIDEAFKGARNGPTSQPAAGPAPR